MYCPRRLTSVQNYGALFLNPFTEMYPKPKQTGYAICLVNSVNHNYTKSF